MSGDWSADRPAPATRQQLPAADIVRAVVAAATACAAVIHFAYAPAHFDHTTSHGAFFAVVGWAQLLLAGALAFRAPPPRLWLAVAAGLNGLVALVWLVSRTVGVPGEDGAEPVGFPDVLTTILEVVAVAGAAALLAGWVADRAFDVRPTLGGAALGATAAMLLVSFSIAPSFAGSHAHGEGGHGHDDGEAAHGHDSDELAAGDHGHDEDDPAHGHESDDEDDDGHGHDDDTDDDGHGHDDDGDGGDHHDDDGDGHDHDDGDDDRRPSLHDPDDHDDDHPHGPTTTTPHDHGPGPGPTTTTTHGGHGHGTTTTTTHGHHPPDPDPEDDWATIRMKALTGNLSASQIAVFRARAAEHLSGQIRARSQFLAGLPAAERERRIAAFVDWSVDNALEAENGHSHGPEPWIPLTDPDDQRALQVQLAAAGRVIGRFPTAADAVAGGYVQVTPYVPGIAAHYMNFGLQDRRFDPSYPEMLLYNGNDPTSELVGVSYAMFGDEPAATDGFVGPNDTWHEHPSLCVIGVFVVGPDHTPDALCESVGGAKLRGNPLWMSHLWQVPGWESQWGLFSGENPAVNMATSDLMDP
jgi:hypothetical protein